MPEPTSTEPAAESAPAASSALDQIDALMAAARANADNPSTQSGTETPPPAATEPAASETSTSTDAPAPSETVTPEAQAPTDTPADETTSDAPESSEEAAETETTPKPTRREAARLQQQLLEAEQRNRELQQQIAERTAVDTRVQQQYQQRLGTSDERARLQAVIANERTSFEDLESARARLRQMQTASEELSPVYQAIEKQVMGHFVAGLNDLRTLDGMSETDHQALFGAKTGADALRLMHGIGQKAAAAEYEGQIRALKASLSELKTKQAATRTQPAAGNGSSAPAPSPLHGLIGPDGLPTEEAISRAKSGALRSLPS